MKKEKLPTDANKRAKSIVDLLTSEDTKSTKEEGKTDIQIAAAILGRKGGLKGGNARAASLTPTRRSEIAKKAAAARWNKKKD